MASSASALPWLWVIEALASFKEVDPSILKELVKRTPEITGDMGIDAREMVHFRVLDTLASQQDRSIGVVSPAPVSGNKIDLSESCENVVVRMLNKRTDVSRLEVQNFIKQKRASLPTYTLEKLKDAILEGKHPALALLKEKSGLSTSKRSRERTSIDDVVLSEAMGLSDGQTVEGGDLTSSNAEKLNAISQKDCGNGYLTPSKRDTSYLEGENQNQGVRSHTDNPRLDYGDDTHLQITKKPKHSAHVSGLVMGHEPPSTVRDEWQKALVDEMELDLPDKEAKDDRRSCAEIGTSKAAPTIRAHENIYNKPSPNSEKSGGMYFNTGRECSSDTVGYHEEGSDIPAKRCNFLSSQYTFTQDSLAIADCTELRICMKCKEGGNLLVCSGAACRIVVHQSCLSTAPTFDSRGNFFCPFCTYSRAISEYLKIKEKASTARKDIAAFIGFKMKMAQKSVRPEHSQDRQDVNVSENNQKHQNHVNDVVNSENRDNIRNMQQGEPSRSDGNASSNVEGVLEDDGTVFASKESNREGGKVDQQGHSMMDLEGQKIENGHTLKEIAEKSIGTAQNHQKDNKVNKQNKKHQKHVNHAINFGNMENTGDIQQSEPATSNGNPPLRANGALAEDGMTFNYKESSRKVDKIGPEYQPAMASEIQPIEARDSQNRCNISPPSRERELVPTTKEHAFEQVESSTNVDIAAASGKGSPSTSDYVMRPWKQEMQYCTYPAIPQLRRKTVPWTREEEEVLEEGVKRFSGSLDKAKKWKDILEFGGHVFLKGRTAIDLKDKWRNICKRRSKS